MLDTVLFLLIGMLLFGITAQPIMEHSKSFNDDSTLVDESIANINKMYSDSHLAIKDKDNNYSNEEALNEYLKNKVNKSDYFDNGSYKDIFLYFFVEFAPNKLTSTEAIKYTSVESINEKYLSYNTDSIIVWEKVDNDISKPLHITDDARDNISQYLANVKTSSSEQYYLAYSNCVNSFMAEAGNYFVSSNEYQELVRLYNWNNAHFLKHYTVSSLIIYTVTFALYYVMIPLLFKDGQTIGMYLLHQAVFDEKRKYVSKKQIILRAILQYFCYFTCIGLMPFLQIGMYSLSMPFIFIKESYITVIIPMLISLTLLVVSTGFMNFSQTWQNLPDRCSKTIVGKIVVPIKETENKETSDGRSA